MSYSPFQNPRKDWTNIDILYTEDGRKEFLNLFPDLYYFLDWPELRKFFEKYESDSLKLKKISRYFGMLAVALSTIGLSIIAFVPWAANYFEPEPLTLVALGLLGAGVLMGLWMRFMSSATRSWLLARFWAERARQFQFQYMISHLNELVAAMRSEDARELWLKARAEAFGQFAFDAKNDPAGIFERTVSDNAGQKFWLDSAGCLEVRLPQPSAQRDKILSYLKKLRVGYQLQYARSQNRAGNIYSKKGLAGFAAQTMFVLIVAFIFATLGIGIYILSGSVKDENLNLFFGLQGFFAAMIAGVRVLEEGLGWRAEASRYMVYEAGLVLAEAKVDSTTDSDIADGLLDVEKLAYDELRGFLIAHQNPRFII